MLGDMPTSWDQLDPEDRAILVGLHEQRQHSYLDLTDLNAARTSTALCCSDALHDGHIDVAQAFAGRVKRLTGLICLYLAGDLQLWAAAPHAAPTTPIGD